MALVIALAAAACSATPRASAALDRAARRLVPPSTAGLLYVIRPDYRGRTFRFDVLADGRWIGSTGGLRYIFTFLSPGQHVIESRAEGVAFLRIQVRSAETYYVEQRVVPGVVAPRNRLVLLSPGQGVRRIRSCYLSREMPPWALSFAAAVAAGPGALIRSSVPPQISADRRAARASARGPRRPSGSPSPDRGGSPTYRR